MGEGDPAREHQAEEETLCLIVVLSPDGHRQQRSREPSRLARDQTKRVATIEHRIDRVQSPRLVEDDPIGEQARPVEHHAQVVQVVEQAVRRSNASFSLAEGDELGRVTAFGAAARRGRGPDPRRARPPVA